MKVVKENSANIGEIVQILRKGGLVIFPCETVYGIGCDCENETAILKLNKYKKRPAGKPYAVMVEDQEMAEKYANLNQTAKNLYKKFLPGPLTVISSGRQKVAAGVESETGSLGIRMPDYAFMVKLISSFGRPIVATSANASYKKRPYKLEDIWENISEKQKRLVDLAVDAGELPHNEPSTVIDTTLDDPVTLRQGEIRLTSGNRLLSRSEENTQNAGKELWQKYEKYRGQRAVVFALEGPMGAGKTQMVKGLAKAMGIEEEIISPTFNLELEYETKDQDLKLIHFDAWRMEKGEELEQLGFRGLIGDKSVLAIEWADRVAEIVRKFNEEAVIVWIKIEYLSGENEREISWGGI